MFVQAILGVGSIYYIAIYGANATFMQETAFTLEIASI